MDNPFDNLIPDFNVFGAEFTTWWQKLFTGLWAVGIIVSAAFLIVALLKIRKANNNTAPGQEDDAKSQAMWAGAALGGLVGFGVILTAIFALFG